MFEGIEKWPLFLQIAAAMGVVVGVALTYYFARRSGPVAETSLAAPFAEECRSIRADFHHAITSLRTSVDGQLREESDKREELEKRVRFNETRIEVLYDRDKRPTRGR